MARAASAKRTCRHSRVSGLRPGQGALGSGRARTASLLARRPPERALPQRRRPTRASIRAQTPLRVVVAGGGRSGAQRLPSAVNNDGPRALLKGHFARQLFASSRCGPVRRAARVPRPSQLEQGRAGWPAQAFPPRFSGTAAPAHSPFVLVETDSQNAAQPISPRPKRCDREHSQIAARRVGSRFGQPQATSGSSPGPRGRALLRDGRQHGM
jgi:hypothetical protein